MSVASETNGRRASEADDVPTAESVLVTGFPAFTARRLVDHILARDPAARVSLLVGAAFLDDARTYLAAQPERGARVRVIEGDVTAMDLGLAGDELATLAGEATTIHHLAGVYWPGVDRAAARRVNVGGTRGVLELAREAPRLRRLVHWSSATVSGKRKGVILEEELDEGQSFHNVYEETKLEAEKLVRAAMHGLPITIVRPGLIVGDSATGEIDKYDGPYYLMMLIATSAVSLRVPLAGRGTAPLHLVPIDFVIEAAYALSRDERAAGRTFHLTDPNPFAARTVYQRVAELSDGRVPRGLIGGGLARALLRAPGVERLAQVPRHVVEAFDRPCFYNCRGTLELLRGTAIACPSFDRYAEQLIHHVRRVHTEKQRVVADDVRDSLDS